MGLLWRPGAGACPNLPQRRPGPGSAAKKSAEYQRFSSGVPARSGPLWQIWTTGATAGPVGRASPASARSTTSTPARAPARRAVADRAGAPFDRAGPARAPPEPRPAPRRRPNPRDRHLTHENVPLADVLAGYPAISAVKWRSRRLPGDLADRDAGPGCPGRLFSGRLRAFPGGSEPYLTRTGGSGPGSTRCGDERARGGTGGTPVATRGEVVSKSATKAPRAGIGREEQRGISTILFRRSGSIRALVADLDNWRRRGPRGEGVRGPGGGPGACLDDPAGPVDPRRTRGSAGPGQDPDARPDPRGLAHPRAPPARPRSFASA